MTNKKKINIATPVVWAESGMINQFAGNMDKFINDLNDTAQRCEEHFEVGKAVMDIHSVTQTKLLSFFGNVDIQCLNTPVNIRKDKGMAHWWYTCVQRAFNVSSPVDAVLYYPIDVCWEDTPKNTVVNTFRVCGMLKQLSKNDNELLVIGNYVSTNRNKEWIEEEVLHILRSKYPNLSKEVTRVRSEFWGISRKLFENFEKKHFKNGQFPIADDPILLLIMYCLLADKTIMPYDLGSYRVEGEWGHEKMRQQIERARRLIENFKQ